MVFQAQEGDERNNFRMAMAQAQFNRRGIVSNAGYDATSSSLCRTLSTTAWSTSLKTEPSAALGRAVSPAWTVFVPLRDKTLNAYSELSRINL